jgi:hypothetical protein
MTVGELRKILEDLPDNMMVSCNDSDGRSFDIEADVTHCRLGSDDHKATSGNDYLLFNGF